MMKKQKSRFWLFLFSLFPGAGHMYLGLMRMGLSFMFGFMLSVALMNITGLDVLVVLPLTIYIYSFFHANNIGGMDDEAFAALEDEYLLGFGDIDRDRFRLDQRNRNLAAAVLIILGICMLWNVGFGMVRDYIGWDNPIIKAIYYTVRDDVPRVVIAIAIIWVGVTLLRGRKESGPVEESPRAQVKQIEEIVQTEQMNQTQQKEDQDYGSTGKG